MDKNIKEISDEQLEFFVDESQDIVKEENRENVEVDETEDNIIEEDEIEVNVNEDDDDALPALPSKSISDIKKEIGFDDPDYKKKVAQKMEEMLSAEVDLELGKEVLTSLTKKVFGYSSIMKDLFSTIITKSLDNIAALKPKDFTQTSYGWAFDLNQFSIGKLNMDSKIKYDDLFIFEELLDRTDEIKKELKSYKFTGVSSLPQEDYYALHLRGKTTVYLMGIESKNMYVLELESHGISSFSLKAMIINHCTPPHSFGGGQLLIPGLEMPTEDSKNFEFFNRLEIPFGVDFRTDELYNNSQHLYLKEKVKFAGKVIRKLDYISSKIDDKINGVIRKKKERSDDMEMPHGLPVPLSLLSALQ